MFTSRIVVVVVAIICAAYVPRGVEAWGDVGHQVTAYVAQKLLSTSAASTVNDILNGDDLVAVAVWADTVKRKAGYTWSAKLHYADAEDWKCNFDQDRDCPDGNCVPPAVSNYTSRVNDASLSDDQVTEALKFLTHFAGDIHQPLHIGFASDEGGNKIKGTYNGKSDNLHMIWDTAMIQERLDNDFNSDQDQFAAYLVTQVQGPWAANATAWAKCASGDVACPNDWATETGALACSNAYVDADGNQIEDGFSLDDDYYTFNQGVIEQQLAKGGVRLASVLNQLFNSHKLRSNEIPIVVA